MYTNQQIQAHMQAQDEAILAILAKLEITPPPVPSEAAADTT